MAARTEFIMMIPARATVVVVEMIVEVVMVVVVANLIVKTAELA